MKEILRKLKSRKLWAAVAAFAGALLLALFGGDGDYAPWQSELLQKGIAALCIYIGGESAVDIAALFKGASPGSPSPGDGKD